MTKEEEIWINYFKQELELIKSLLLKLVEPDKEEGEGLGFNTDFFEMVDGVLTKKGGDKRCR